MKHDDESGEDALAGIDLHMWRVPPASAEGRPALLARALSSPPRRSRMVWMFAACAILNVALAAILVIIISNRPGPASPTVLPGGGSLLDEQVKLLELRYELERRTLEQKLAGVDQQIANLTEKIRLCEKTTKRSEPEPRHEAPIPVESGSCDEVSCVLGNYAGACCDRFRRPPPPSVAGLPDTLTRAMITASMAAVKPQVRACDPLAAVTGKVKVRVRVDTAGTVTSVTVEQASDAALGTCVASAVRKASFERTVHGGSFSYPFVFTPAR